MDISASAPPPGIQSEKKKDTVLALGKFNELPAGIISSIAEYAGSQTYDLMRVSRHTLLEAGKVLYRLEHTGRTKEAPFGRELKLELLKGVGTLDLGVCGNCSEVIGISHKTLEDNIRRLAELFTQFKRDGINPFPGLQVLGFHCDQCRCSDTIYRAMRTLQVSLTALCRPKVLLASGEGVSMWDFIGAVRGQYGGLEFPAGHLPWVVIHVPGKRWPESSGRRDFLIPVVVYGTVNVVLVPRSVNDPEDMRANIIGILDYVQSTSNLPGLSAGEAAARLAATTWKFWVQFGHDEQADDGGVRPTDPASPEAGHESHLWQAALISERVKRARPDMQGQVEVQWLGTKLLAECERAVREGSSTFYQSMAIVVALQEYCGISIQPGVA
ncbi:hypothetical protein IAT38_001495 [Cryptococcus sp. DSM 104549]